MKIARVKCLKGRLAIHSLGVTLMAGQEAEFTSTQFAQSIELQKAYQTQQVSVQWRTDMSKKSIPPRHITASRGKQKRTTPTPTPNPRVEPSNEALKQTIQQEVAQMKQELVGEIAKMLGGLTGGVNPEQMAEMINQAVASNMPKVVSQGSTPQESSLRDEDEPIYIPSDITNTGTIQGGSVSVSSVSSEDTSLSDAASALRAMKKNRRK
jgi:hypothetical protein